jgi:hypothetical protein
VAIQVTWVAIGQARMGLAAGMLARAISYLVASLSWTAGQARLRVTMRVNSRRRARRSQRCRRG